MRKVLVIEDEAPLLRAMQINLHAEGYQVIPAADGASGLRLAAEQMPHIIVLDLGLPDMDGVEVIGKLRLWCTIPIVVLSARHGAEDKITALDAGADDYVTKPFGLDELLARLRAVERRSVTDAHTPRIDAGDLLIDLAGRTVLRNGVVVRLTGREWGILRLLAQKPGTLISQQHILNEVWGAAYSRETHYLRVYIGHLRRKLETDPANPVHIITEPGSGYRFEP